jgi:hypothetical protein
MYVCVLMAAQTLIWCDEGPSGTCRSCSAGGGCMQQWMENVVWVWRDCAAITCASVVLPWLLLEIGSVCATM